MGRKVHPTGIRLKIIKDWNARWYAEGRRYGELLHEDLAIRDLKEGAGLEHCPSGHFFANAWLACAVLAHNLTRWTSRLSAVRAAAVSPSASAASAARASAKR